MPDCPPPVIRKLNMTPSSTTIQPGSFGQSGGSQPFVSRFRAPNWTIGIQLYVNVTDWDAQSIRAELALPQGESNWTEETDGASSGLLSSARNEPLSWLYNSTIEEDRFSMPAGPYSLHVNATMPIRATIRVEGLIGIACGGLMS